MLKGNLFSRPVIAEQVAALIGNHITPWPHKLLQKFLIDYPDYVD